MSVSQKELWYLGMPLLGLSWVPAVVKQKEWKDINHITAKYQFLKTGIKLSILLSKSHFFSPN